MDALFLSLSPINAGGLFCLSLVLQVVRNSVGQGKVGKKVESVTADAAPDALTTQLAQQSRCSYGDKTMKHYIACF